MSNVSKKLGHNVPNALDLSIVNDVAINLINENKKAVENVTIKRIHPDINTYYFTVNIFNGPQGTGKTYSAMLEIIKISMVDPNSHLLIYISKDGDKVDPTIESLKSLLTIDIVYVKYADAVEYVKQLLLYKNLYNEIKREKLENKICDDQVEELNSILHINDFSRDFLHTLILFDDVSNNRLFKDQSSYFNELITQCRKIHCTFFMTIQFWKGVSPNIKANTTTATIFAGFSKQQFRYICSQVASSIPFDVLYSVYQQLKEHEKLIMNNRTNEALRA